MAQLSMPTVLRACAICPSVTAKAAVSFSARARLRMSVPKPQRSTSGATVGSKRPWLSRFTCCATANTAAMSASALSVSPRLMREIRESWANGDSDISTCRSTA